MNGQAMQNFDPEACEKLEKRVMVALAANLETVKLLESLHKRIMVDNAALEKRLQILEAYLPPMREKFAGQIAGKGAGQEALENG